MTQTNTVESVPVATVPVSVIIPTRERDERLKATLAEIMKCDPLPAEILIHFDAEEDAQHTISADYPVPLKTFRSEKILGPGGSRNVLLKNASCEIICSFDDDSYPVDSDYFARVVNTFESLPEAAVVTASIQTPGGVLAEAAPTASACRIFDGCAASLRRSAVLKTGGYVPLPTAYGMEEADMSLQLSAEGYRIFRTDWLRVRHDTFDSSEKTKSFAKHTLKNQALLGYLRYPLFLAPIALYQCLRRILWAKNHLSYAQVWEAIREIPGHIGEHQGSKHRLPALTVLRYLLTPPLGRARSLAIAVPAAGLPQPDVAAKLGALAHPGRKILYCQYTNPGAYPPLEHCSRILANRGWDVRFLGVGMIGAESLAFPPHARIRVSSFGSCPPGWRQKLHYIRYTLWVAWRALRDRPDVLYCSDLFSCFPGLMAKSLSGATLVYHEHDIPDERAAGSAFMKLSLRARRKMGHRAEMVIVPNQDRLEFYLAQTGRTAKNYCVWNCPRREELEIPLHARHHDGPLRLVYHGTIVPARLPTSIVQALAELREKVHFTIIGYTTIGSPGYDLELLECASSLGIADQLEILPPISRFELMQTCGEYDVGLALLPIDSGDINTSQMIGASNKVYDYLSQALPVLVSAFPAWEEHVVEPAYGRSCDPGDPASIARALTYFIEHPEEADAMGRRGREKIVAEWNYDAQFAPVLEALAK